MLTKSRLAFSDSYHSEKTLKTMDKYRIGRIQGPWLNLTPPIRGGFQSEKRLVEDIPSSDDDSLELSATTSSSETSLEDIFDKEIDANVLKLEVGSKDWRAWRVKEQSRRIQRLPRKEYIMRAEQNEIDDDHRTYPSLDTQTQRNISWKYEQLHQRIKDEGFYDCPYLSYGKEFLRYSLLFACFITALRAEWFLTSAAFLGLFWHQIMFTAHDGGHLAITHNFIIDTLIAMFVADFCCGLSIGWWKSSHNVHHLVTNHPVRRTSI
jgi:delta8-fatty-acid desaturase